MLSLLFVLNMILDYLDMFFSLHGMFCVCIGHILSLEDKTTFQLLFHSVIIFALFGAECIFSWSRLQFGPMPSEPKSFSLPQTLRTPHQKIKIHKIPSAL